MGKNRHSKDKLYIVASEFAKDWGGCKKREARLPFRCLPFYCCGLSLLPFTTPVCTKEGVIFDADNIIPYIEKYNRNPVTGQPLGKNDLILLRFHKNNDGQFHCPVTFKEFNEHSYIVANRKSGHVYSNDAIDALCRRPQTWLDLLTNEKFSPSDLITIQNPHNITSRKIDEFDYVKTGKLLPTRKQDVEGIPADEGALDPKMKKNPFISQIIEESHIAEKDRKDTHNKLIPNVHFKHSCTNELHEVRHNSSDSKTKHSLFTTHRQAASFTSTTVHVAYDSEYRSLTEQEIRNEMYLSVKKKKEKAYVRLVTTLGPLNFELHCDKVPETCHNFLKHCESGYYKNTIFHRSIPHFMIQGGDPTGTGTGGDSAFEGTNKSFRDEFHPHLVHKGPGILSMANSGPHTNRSQFFITYNSCEHLNNIHSVFGRLVGGLPVLRKMEELKIIENDHPKHPPSIVETIIFKNPFEEYIIEQEKQKKDEEDKRLQEGTQELTQTELLDPMRNHVNRSSKEVGKYTDFKKVLHTQKQGLLPLVGTNSTFLKNESKRQLNIQKDDNLLLKRSKPNSFVTSGKNEFSFSSW